MIKYGVILIGEDENLQWLMNSFTDIKVAEATRLSFIKLYHSENPQNIQVIQYVC